jgi:hypothetical protein
MAVVHVWTYRPIWSTVSSALRLFGILFTDISHDLLTRGAAHPYVFTDTEQHRDITQMSRVGFELESNVHNVEVVHTSVLEVTAFLL